MRAPLLPALLLPAAIYAAFALTGCSSNKSNPNASSYPTMGGASGDSSATRLGGEDAVFGVGKGNSKDQAPGSPGIGVNAFLWRGALDTIAFMPLASADPFGGVIITDWYTPPGTSGERFKATIYILSRDLRSDGLRVNIYRQVLQGNQWADSTVAESTVDDIENKVLARARHMREQLQASS